MRFRHLITNETYQINVSSEQRQVVETIPGWVHDITNIGHTDAYVLLWANEIFNKNNPDSISLEV
jgi:UDP-2-acetamido-2,6-beta-L-arabino-hexul-4-ose reductase